MKVPAAQHGPCPGRNAATQHLIDPELCSACQSCLAVCPEQAIVAQDRRVAIDPQLCRFCRTCVEECPSGAIDVWHPVTNGEIYDLDQQFDWERLP
ncbi:hypothetical protein LK12_21795 [Novosphingobium malaysiense]|uniref:4Fe-4S ferredoxin-type domain-containing protein n=1 Tax=Novosphingobium malaysiense TaxID=1348853 RepID=A0A0B1ZJ20_9SPHN|nr:hypothetical protein LK12_21795 [Novosphingobium malaysiense]